MFFKQDLETGRIKNPDVYGFFVMMIVIYAYVIFAAGIEAPKFTYAEFSKPQRITIEI